MAMALAIVMEIPLAKRFRHGMDEMVRTFSDEPVLGCSSACRDLPFAFSDLLVRNAYFSELELKNQ